jgi:bifunctional non-homologous end joining protein LigD
MEADPPEASNRPRFVVQKHTARTLHYDFRLEKDGVFKSWAVPKGLPEKAGKRHLALQVEDHTLAFGGFEGTIPDGEYGAGQIEIWDKGGYDIADWGDDNISFTLHGARCRGRFRLIRFPRGGVRAWLLLKDADVPHKP